MTTDFLYDGHRTVQELSSGSAQANLLLGSGIDEVLQRTETSSTSHFLADGLSSTLALTDNTGTVQTEYTYEPFGNTTLSGAASANPSQYTGRENDGTGLYYYRARYYHPGLQRFISQDPIGFGGGINLYAHVENNPVNFTDPQGLSPLGAIKKALQKVHEHLGGSLPKGLPGKFGSPQRSNPLKGYRLDPAHPDALPGSPDSQPHINWWDYTKGKRKGGDGRKGTEPIDNYNGIESLGNLLDPFDPDDPAGPEDDMLNPDGTPPDSDPDPSPDPDSPPGPPKRPCE